MIPLVCKISDPYYTVGMDVHQYISTFLAETIEIAKQIDQSQIQAAIGQLRRLQTDGGRLFILGNGGSAANASHAVNDFRKIAGIETYAPTDNVAELTAWVNDVGWEVTFANWLETSRLSARDVVMVFSVGGGSETASQNLTAAVTYAKSVNSTVLAIVSRDGGKVKAWADVTILVPSVAAARVVPHAESWQAVLWHLFVNALKET